MTQAVPLEDRVAKLEVRTDHVEGLARRTDKEVSDWRTTLSNHTELLNAIRNDHVDHGKRLTRVEAGLADVRSEMDAMRSEMRNGFGKLAKGQELITELLDRHLGTSDDETPAGGAGE